MRCTIPVMDHYDPVRERRRRLPIWPFIAAGFMLLVGAFVFAAVAIPISMPYYAMSPGPVSDVSDYIEVENPSQTTEGENCWNVL